MRKALKDGLVVLCFALLICGLAFGSQAQAATVITNAPDINPPGSFVTIVGTGFAVNETVTVQITHYDGTPAGGLGHDPWNVVAPGTGNFQTFWTVPFDDNLDEIMLVRATGQSTGYTAQSTFLCSNTKLDFTLAPPDSVCPGGPDDSILVCAQLLENCHGGNDLPLQGRPLIFFINLGNCGVNVGENGDDTALTDANGIACAKLRIPSTPGKYSIRVKFLGEDEPSDSEPPNSACDPNARVHLSAANECESFYVNSGAAGGKCRSGSNYCAVYPGPYLLDSGMQ